MIRQHLHVVPTLIMMAALLGALPALARQALDESVHTKSRPVAPAAGAHLLR